jgi:hypothetical protein
MGTSPKNAYQLSDSQVTTPRPIVSLFWRVTLKYRQRFDSVLDLGAGDGRFSRGGHYKDYVGVEIDPKKAGKTASLRKGARLITGCAFRHRASDYDGCIGNPPYVRHHDIESPWKERTVDWIESQLNVRLNRRCNVYLYFMCLGMVKTHDEGLLALIIPYEWVSRPSAEAVRRYIRKEGWDVNVYRFTAPIFDNVLTTASVTIIDKRMRNEKWSYFEIDSHHNIVQRRGILEGKNAVLPYSSRSRIWATRGLSPGTQKVFTLTEAERVKHGLSRRDVMPCVTSLRAVPKEITTLSGPCFQKRFVSKGQRCWLIRTQGRLRQQVANYLASVTRDKRDTYTCRNQHPWYNYVQPPIFRVLVSSAFTGFGPKALINSVGAVAVGTVSGISTKKQFSGRRLIKFLSAINFGKKVVPHAHTLRKVEVKQFNAVLKRFAAREFSHGKAAR